MLQSESKKKKNIILESNLYSNMYSVYDLSENLSGILSIFQIAADLLLDKCKLRCGNDFSCRCQYAIEHYPSV